MLATGDGNAGVHIHSCGSDAACHWQCHAQHMTGRCIQHMSAVESMQGPQSDTCVHNGQLDTVLHTHAQLAPLRHSSELGGHLSTHWGVLKQTCNGTYTALGPLRSQLSQSWLWSPAHCCIPWWTRGVTVTVLYVWQHEAHTKNPGGSVTGVSHLVQCDWPITSSDQQITDVIWWVTPQPGA